MAIIEFHIYREDSLSFNAKEVSLEELGVKDFNEFYLKLKKDRKFFTNIVKMFNPKAITENDEIDIIELAGTPSVYEASCSNIEEMKNTCATLVIEKYNDKIRFKIDGDPCGFSWVIERHPRKPWLSILTIEQYGKKITSVLRNFELHVDSDINDMCTLFKALVENPGKYFNGITDIGREIRFDAIKVINYSDYPGLDFEECKYREGGSEHGDE
jgi:hypothetical protein